MSSPPSLAPLETLLRAASLRASDRATRKRPTHPWLIEHTCVIREASVDLVITAEQAHAILETWTVPQPYHADPLADHRVATYVAAMRAGEWCPGSVSVFNVGPDAIEFGDGHHRLYAQRISGTTQSYSARARILPLRWIRLSA